VLIFETLGNPALDELHEVLTQAGATVSHVTVRSRSGRIVQQLELVRQDGKALSEGKWSCVQAAFLGYVGDSVLLGQPRNTRSKRPQESLRLAPDSRS
jgi:hypothetical protein